MAEFVLPPAIRVYANEKPSHSMSRGVTGPGERRLQVSKSERYEVRGNAGRDVIEQRQNFTTKGAIKSTYNRIV